MGSGIVLARALGPQGLGQFALVLAVVSAGALVANLGGTETATRFIPAIKAGGTLKKVVAVMWPLFAARLLMSVAVAAVIILLRGTMGELPGMDGVFTLSLAAVAGSHVLLASFQGPAQVLLVNFERQRYLTTVTALANLSALLAVFALAVTGHLTVERAVAVVTMALAIRVVLFCNAAFHCISQAPDVQNAAATAPSLENDLRGRMTRYGGVMFLIAVGGFLLQTRSDAYLISAILGIQAVAYYHLASGFTRTVYGLPVSRTADFFLTGMLTEGYVRHGLPSVRHRFRQIVKMRLLLSVPVAFGGTLLARHIVEAVYGAEYAPAAGLLAIFFLLQLPLQWTGAISGVLVAIEKPQWFLWTKAVAIVTVPLTIWWLHLWGLPGAALATTLGTGLAASIEFLAARHHAGIRFPFRDVARYAAAGGVMAGVVALISNTFSAPAWGILAIAAPAGATSYAGALLLLRAFSPGEWAVIRSLLTFPRRRSKTAPGPAGDVGVSTQLRQPVSYLSAP